MNFSARAGASASPFAHLLSSFSGGRAKAAAVEDDRTDDEARADDGADEDEDDKTSKKARGAKADDEDTRADDGEDEDGDDKKSKKAKKAKASDDDDEEGGDDHEKGRKAERARWAQVLKSPAAAGGRVAAACEMLSNTPMTASAIVRTLGALPAAPAAAARPGLRERMEGAPQPKVGPDGGAGPSSPTDNFAAEMAAATGLARAAR